MNPNPVKTLIVPIPLLMVVGMLLITAALPAQNIGNWTLNNTLTGTGGSFNSVSAISAGSAVPTTAFNGGTEWYGQNGFPTGSSPNLNAYLQFTLTPNSGYEINVSSIVLRMRRSNTGSPAGSGPTQWCLRSSQDGYTTNLMTGSMNHNYSNYTVLLTGFNQLPSAVTFRLYGYSVTVGSGGNNRLVLDNVSAQGVLFILPLKLEAPEAKSDEKGNIDINWKALDVMAGTKFSLQRSSDGNSFETIHTVTEGSDQASRRYTYSDQRIPAALQQVYYRVQAVEPGGASYLSRVITVNRKISAALHIEKIAVRGALLQAFIQTPVSGNYTIAVYSSSGTLLQKQTLYIQAGARSVPVSLQNRSNTLYGDRKSVV